jgi:hypothetical protein
MSAAVGAGMSQSRVTATDSPPALPEGAGTGDPEQAAATDRARAHLVLRTPHSIRVEVGGGMRDGRSTECARPGSSSFIRASVSPASES